MKVYVLVSGSAQPGKYREARKAVVERRTNDAEWSRIFESVRQTVDLNGITTQILGALEA